MKQFPVTALCLYSIFSMTAMAGMNLGFLTVALSALIFFKRKSLKLTISVREYLIFGGILFFACLLSLIVAKIDPASYAGHAPEITAHGFLKIWYLLCPGILLLAFSSVAGPEKTFDRMITSWWSMTIFLSAIAVIQFYTGWPLEQKIPTNPGHFHAILWFGHHLSTSSIIIFPTFTAMAVGLGTYLRSGRIAKLATSTAIAGLLILFLSYARTAWLAIPIGIILVWARSFRPRTVLLSGAVLFLLLAAAAQTPLLKERIHNAMGITERIDLWKANIDFFEKRPLTGIGWLKTAEMSEFYFKEKFPEHYHEYFWGHAHSNFFEMLGGTGLIGLLAFLLWSFFTLKLAARIRGESLKRGDAWSADFAWGIFVALILLHFNGLTNVTFWEGKVMHTQMFAVGLLLMMERMNRTSSSKH